MCPHQNADATLDAQDMVAVEAKTNHLNGANGHSTSQRHNPYAPRASDFLNHVSNFKIIESTLRGAYLYP